MLSCRLRIFAFILLALCAPIACVSMEGIDNRRPGAGSNSALNYYRNRVMDLRDIVTLSFTIGLQAGATVQIGPAALGAAFVPGGGGHGSLASEYGWRHGEFGDVYTTLFVPGFSLDEQSGTVDGRSDLRGKDTNLTSHEASQDGLPANLRRPHNYTRLGFYLGFIGGLTFEVNPGEFLDFVLGLFTIDIYSDDIYKRDYASPTTNE